MSKAKDLTGMKFGKLTVIKKTERKNKCRQYYWLCRCDCGKMVEVLGVSLTSGHTKSCGCYNVEKHTAHAKCYTRLYSIYKGMRNRCYNTKHISYGSYGGRGITIHDEWLNDFMNFYNWAMENDYNDDLTIDRINVNGNYEPNNCRFINMEQQSNNKRNNTVITYKDEIHTVSEWARIKSIKVSTLRARIETGWSIAEALEIPVKKYKLKRYKNT